MTKKTFAWLTLVIFLCMAGILYFLSKPHPKNTPTKLRLEVQEIISAESKNANAVGDRVVFSNGDEVDHFGFEVRLVGVIYPAEDQVVFLFRGNSCRGCDPEVNLWIYSASNKQTEKLLYPSRHSLVAADSDQEVIDSEQIAIYGRCFAGQSGVWLASKSRMVESDGQRLQPSESWDYKVLAITLGPDGSIQKTTTSEDAFESFLHKKSSDCHFIEPEEHQDYISTNVMNTFQADSPG